MTCVCIAVVDAARARVFTFEELDGRDGVLNQDLRERVDLVDPDRRMRASELFSDTRPGADRAPSGRGFAVDDHRDGHLRELDRRFAADVMARIAEVVRAYRCDRLVLAASPGMLGKLRKRASRRLVREVSLDEVARDVTHLSPSQIHDYLAERSLLPPRERLVTAVQ